MSSSNMTNDYLIVLNTVNTMSIMFTRYWCITMFLIGLIGHSTSAVGAIGGMFNTIDDNTRNNSLNRYAVFQDFLIVCCIKESMDDFKC